jgi:hypothetical protein
VEPCGRDGRETACNSTWIDDKVDRHAYTFGALERLQDALRRRDVYLAALGKCALVLQPLELLLPLRIQTCRRFAFMFVVCQR